MLGRDSRQVVVEAKWPLRRPSNKPLMAARPFGHLEAEGKWTVPGRDAALQAGWEVPCPVGRQTPRAPQMACLFACACLLL